MNKEVKTLIVLGFFAFILLIVMILFSGKKGGQVTPSPTPDVTLSPTINAAKERIKSELPYTGSGFTIEYFPDDDSYFIQINKAPYETYATAAKKWFTDRSLNPDTLNIVWSSTRGVAPKQ